MAYPARARAIAPAMICIITPTIHPSRVHDGPEQTQISRNTITLTDMKAVQVARMCVPAVRNFRSIEFSTERSYESSSFDS